MGRLCPNSNKCARQETCKCFLKLWDEGQQVGKLVRLRIQQDYRDRQCVEVLLILEILVDRDKGVELVCGSGEELAVPNAALPHFDHRSYAAWPGRERLSRCGTDSSSSRRICEEARLGYLENRYRSLTGDRGEVLQKVFKR